MTPSPSEFREEVEKLERKHAENPEGRYFVPLANAYRRSGDLRRAMSLLRQGLEKHPDYLSAHIVLGRCLADQGEAGAAEAEFRYVLSLDPQNLIALRTLGELAAGQSNVADARKWYQELLSVDPMNEDARRALESLEITAPPEEDRRESAQGEAAPWEWPAPERQAEAAADFASTPDNHESLFGTMIDIENTGSDGDLVFSDEGNAVVTETIAELYTRQGFYDRAADVYRELLRRRGSDPALEERLRQVTELAAGSASAAETVTAFDESAYSAPSQASHDDPGFGTDPFAGSFSDGFSPGLESPESLTPTGFGAAEYPPLETSGYGYDFATTETPGLEIGFAAGESVVFAHQEDPGDATEPAAPAWAEPEQTSGGAQSLSIRAYLTSVLAWKPGNATGAATDYPFAPPAQTYPFAADDLSEETGIIADDSLDIWAREGFVTDDVAPAGLESDALDREIEEALPLMDAQPAEEADHSWLTGSGFVLEDSPAPSAPSPAPVFSADPPANLPLASDLIDDELFPWELPAAHPAVADAIEAQTVPVFADDLPLVEEPPRHRDDPPETHVTDSDAFTIVPTAADPFGTEVAPPAPAAPAPATEAAASDSKEDDDLESFQTWLRSLKR